MSIFMLGYVFCVMIIVAGVNLEIIVFFRDDAARVETRGMGGLV